MRGLMSEVQQTQTDFGSHLEAQAPHSEQANNGSGNTQSLTTDTKYADYEAARQRALAAPVPPAFDLDGSKLRPVTEFHKPDKSAGEEQSPSAAATEQDDEDEPIQVVSAETALPKRVNYRPKSHYDLEVVSLQKQGYDWDDAQDMAAKKFPSDPKAIRRNEKLSGNQGQPAVDDNQQQPSTPSETLTSEQVLAELEDIDLKIIQAMTDFDSEAAIALKTRERELKQLLPELQNQERQQSKLHEQDIANQFQGYLDQAKSIFPQMDDENSALYQKAAELQAKARESGDPLYFQPHSALQFVVNAAALLNIKAGAPAPPSSPAPAVSASKFLAATPAAQSQPAPATRPAAEAITRDRYEIMRKQAMGLK